MDERIILAELNSSWYHLQEKCTKRRKSKSVSIFGKTTSGLWFNTTLRPIKASTASESTWTTSLIWWVQKHFFWEDVVKLC